MLIEVVLPMKKLVLIMTMLMVLTALVAACGGTSSATGKYANEVTTIGASFNPSTITIKKGSTITFVDDPNNGGLHILVIGQNAQQEAENGAPDFHGASGKRIDIGDVWTTLPWNTSGTFHVACTVHPAMNLTVIVGTQ